ncbi:MAG: methylated-DNA--[protein]-cysteine S-methyltransferase [Sphingomonadales bacterium]|jgi:methylated-DNA-[protein]-cysteine S-methyltransferase
MPQISLHSPVGDITLSEDDGAIVALDWGWGRDQDETPLLKEAVRQLNRYFDGEEIEFDLPLRPYGTKFQQSVWKKMLSIPYGKTMTYGEMAGELNSVARAVGGACRINPIPIIIPCHRVLAANGKLGGYTADGGIETKEALLRLEGAIEDRPLLI